MKHTPAPWEIIQIYLPTYEENGEVQASGSIRLSNGCELWFSDIHEVKTLSEAEANAKLITAAPDLLEACIKSLEVIEVLGNILNDMDAVDPETQKVNPKIQSIREAIKKALE